MVYCAKCGAQNEDNATHCVSCGEPLKVPHRENRGWEEEIEVRAEEFGERAERFGRRMEDECFGTSRRTGRDECFGLPQGGSIFGIIIGIMIILVGAQSLMGWSIDFGPFIIIIVGILIAAGALYQMNKSKR